MRIFHLHLDVLGALRHPKVLRGCITVEGKKLETTAEVKAFLENQLAMGHECLPMSSECEGFDYKTGCPGHVIPDEEEAHHG